jgi:hypothetical protein
MPDQFRLDYKGSPLLPQFDIQPLVDEVIRYLDQGFEPAAAIAMSIYSIMAVHLLLFRLEKKTQNQLALTEADIQSLDLGYQYPLQTIMASAVCKKWPEEERAKVYERLLASTHNFDSLRAQDQMLGDLKGTINLLNLDPSGALVFEYLKKYPFSNSGYFLNGMEIAAKIFFGIALEVVKRTGDDSWLNKPYDLTIT